MILTDSEYDSDSLDLSSIGEALDWSPKVMPALKRKKKGVVRLSSIDNQFSSLP